MPSNAPFPQKNGSENFRVLLIDDDEELCELIIDYLAPFGIHVEVTHTGQEGAERALGEAWHTVILDVMLPDADGYTAVSPRSRNNEEKPGNTLKREGQGRGRDIWEAEWAQMGL